jgi:hypothetical protein
VPNVFRVTAHERPVPLGGAASRVLPLRRSTLFAPRGPSWSTWREWRRAASDGPRAQRCSPVPARAAGRAGWSGLSYGSPGQHGIRATLTGIRAGQRRNSCHCPDPDLEDSDPDTNVTRIGTLRYVQRRLDTGVPGIRSVLQPARIRLTCSSAQDLRSHTEKYFASGWWNTNASVNFSGCNCKLIGECQPNRLRPQKLHALAPDVNRGSTPHA